MPKSHSEINTPPQEKTLTINQEQLKLRLNSLCYLHIWWKQEGLDGLSESCPSQVSLAEGPAAAPAYLWAVGFSSLPAGGIIQTSQLHPLQEPGDTSPSYCYKACPPEPLVVL